MPSHETFKPIHALPHALTLTNLLCGAFALALIHGGAPIWQAAVAVGVGLVCDLFDGRTARKLGISGPFGTQLDSLADVVTFGAVPAAALYQWKLHALGPLGMLASGAILAAAALRLARFNVDAGKPDDTPPGRFKGLAVTIPAGTVLALATADPVVPAWVVALGAVGLAAAMVSTLPYHSFKDRGLGPVAVPAVLFVAMVAALVGDPVVGLAQGVAMLGLAYCLSAPLSQLRRVKSARGAAGAA